MGIASSNTDVRRIIPEEDWGEWQDLDHLLVEFWESASIRPKVVRPTQVWGGWETIDYIGYRCLFPEAMKRGILDLVDSPTFFREY